MKKKILLALVTLIITTNPVFALNPNSQDESLWNSESGLKKLQNSKFNNDFYQLVNFYQPQENPLFCAIASTTMIRNALNYGNISSQKTGERKSPDDKLISYKLYSQDDFFNNKSESIKKRAVIEYKEVKSPDSKLYDPGITLDEFAKILPQAHGLKVEVTHTAKSNSTELEKFRQTLKTNLLEKKHFVVANFDGKVVGKETRGHFSPLVAYDEATDEVMVMDAALHKNQWYWVSLTKLFSAMNTKDGNSYRGYAVIGL